MVTAKELTELVLKFEELKEQHNLNYAIYTECTMNDKKDYIQTYTIQSLAQLGELLNMMYRCDWEVEITHITSHIGARKENEI